MKIGEYLSYPLKFSEITRALSPAADSLSLEVRFWCYQPPRQNEHRTTYRVLEAEHYGADTDRITISPVPRALRRVVHSLLFPLELERIRDWLLAARTPHWCSTYHALRLDFDTVSQRITCHEHNAAS
jgi:hypothetical protein